jgi:hypothetical protein
MSHPRTALSAAVVVVLALGVSNGTAFAGKFSIGGNFGTGMYSNSDINDILKAETPPRDEISSGWEYGGSLRYGISDKLSIDAEGSKINASSTTSDPAGDGDEHWSVKTFAIPVTLNYALAQSEKYAFNLFAGGGPMISAKLEGRDDTDKIETDGQTKFMGQGGLEGMWLASPKMAITARVLGRTAKISNLESGGVASGIDADLSGVAFSLGLRAFFGGR